MILLQTLSRLHVCATLALAQGQSDHPLSNRMSADARVSALFLGYMLTWHYCFLFIFDLFLIGALLNCTLLLPPTFCPNDDFFSHRIRRRYGSPKDGTQSNWSWIRLPRRVVLVVWRWHQGFAHGFWPVLGWFA